MVVFISTNLFSLTKSTTTYTAISSGYYTDAFIWKNNLIPTTTISSGENLLIDTNVSVVTTSNLVFGSNGGGKKSTVNILGYLGGNNTITINRKNKFTISCGGIVEVDTLIINSANNISVTIDSCAILKVNVLYVGSSIINNGKIIVGEIITDKNVCSNLITGDGIIEYSPILPIELLTFTVIENNKNIYISWSTSTEINNDYFLIEKSIDGFEYFEIGVVGGNGNSNIVNNYSYVDYNVNGGTIYYRLKQVDYDGHSETFVPKAITVDGDEDIIIVKHNRIKISSKTDNNEVIIYNISGKMIHYEKYNENTYIDIFTSGIYIISINSIRYKIYIN